MVERLSITSEKAEVSNGSTFGIQVPCDVRQSRFGTLNVNLVPFSGLAKDKGDRDSSASRDSSVGAVNSSKAYNGLGT